MRFVTCPGCRHGMMVREYERPRCSPCSDPIPELDRISDDGRWRYRYNLRRQLVSREQIWGEPGRAATRPLRAEDTPQGEMVA